MAFLSGPSLDVIGKALSELNIVPLSISYEWETCDYMKALELYQSRFGKYVKKQGEDAKTAVRNIRRDAMDKFKAMKKAGELTEDDQKKLEEETQKLTDKYVKLIDDTCADKNKEIMEV